MALFDNPPNLFSLSPPQKNFKELRSTLMMVQIHLPYSPLFQNGYWLCTMCVLCFYTCLSFCSRGGGCAPVHAGIHPPRQTPPRQTSPSQCMLGYTHSLPSAFWDMHPTAQCMLGYTPPCPVHAGIHMATAADGMYPTGMHSC